MAKSFTFDEKYFERFYRDPRTRVATRRSIAVLGRFVCNYLKYLGQPVTNVLDIGCGLGYWQPVIRRHFPNAAYTGVDISSYLCREYGWKRGSVVDFKSPGRHDLVLCQGVLQYLGNRDASKAIANLRRLCGGALYLETLTVRDWNEHCDRSATDGQVYLRPGQWYRERLRKHFINCGGGLFLVDDASAVLYELERAE